jgi:hypothetical protein
MRPFWTCVFLSFLCPYPLSAQDVFVVAKAGRSSYGSLYVGPVGGGGGDTHWKSGPIISLGARLRTSEAFAADAMVEYSTHAYAAPTWEDPPIGDPRNRLVDVTALGRSSFRFVGPSHFVFMYGLGVSFQRKDVPNSPVSSNDFTGCVILGLGVEVRAFGNLEFAIEGSLRIRRYVTPVAALGVAYSP